MSVVTGVADSGPRHWTVLADVCVATLWATLSSGKRHRVHLYSAPELGRLRAGVLLYDRALDVRRLDSFDSSGALLADH